MAEYFKIKPKYQGYKGERYFKVDYNEDLVVQVVVHTGTDRGKGKNAAIGVYTIQRLTFFSNYLAINLVDKVTKVTFDKKASELFKHLI